MLRHLLTLAVPLAVCTLGVPCPAADATAEGLEFFEKRIRPVLVSHCYECHSADARAAKKLKGGLLLDSRDALRQGGDSGEAVVPGKPDESLLVSVLKHESFEMPPSGKLADAVVADFEKWVEIGAPDPREATTGEVEEPSVDWATARAFWSFRPVADVTPPRVADEAWVTNAVDRFVRARLEEHGLSPARPATKAEWLRRVTFDLTGLPPTPAEVDAFEADDSPAACETVVDRLLDSPRYGERWARHWLDVARYAEDQAHTFAVKPKSGAFRYRDWVVRAFNDDMPYDRFVRLQVAGDFEDESSGDHFTRLAGLGFLGLGAEYYKNSAKEQAVADELDDRVDTLTRGFMGLTVSCARCHDHKFDPIPTRDYYALAGVFNGSRLTEAPLVPADVVRAYDEGQQRVKESENATRDRLREIGAEAARVASGQTAAYVTTAWRLSRLRQAKAKVDVGAVAQQTGLHPYFLGRWLAYLDAKNQGDVVPELRALWDVNAESVTAQSQPDDVAVPAAVSELAAKFQGRLAPLLARDREQGKLAKADQSLVKAIREDGKGPLFANENEAEKNLLTVAEATEVAKRRAELEELKKSVPPKYPVAHVLSGGGQTMPVYLRGNPQRKGDLAPKGFLTILLPDTGATATSGTEYDRADLAAAMTAPDNPLTARVFVNRVWQHHFGRGLVGTSSNFGMLGERPTHPELLDWLAREFVESGWSVKSLHRLVVLSSTYRLSAGQGPRDKGQGPDADRGGVSPPLSSGSGLPTLDSGPSVDPENRWLWRANRRRLDVEAWRDSLLFVSGRLDERMGGPTTNVGDPNDCRRTVYAKISRHELDGLLRLFDFPDANVTSAARTQTTVPQQQLFVLNSEFFVKQAQAFAARLQAAADTDADRIREAYRLAYGRLPSDAERALGLEFLAAAAQPDEGDKLSPWEQYAQALLAANEFLYLD